MLSNKKIFSVGSFEFCLHHLIIVGVLALSFSISAMIRSQAAEYGFQLNEFDPYFNYRATQYIVENGIPAYFDWHDDMSWYPFGRDVANTSQVMLHITTAVLYGAFGGGDLYGFTIIFPVVFGSLTAIIVFALVRVIGGTTAGLFAAMMYSVSLPIITRGSIGWFKSEPLGLFYGLLAVYLFLSGIKSTSHKIAAAKLLGGGIFLGFGFSAWGGTDFFVLPIGLFIVSLVFTRKDSGFLRWAIPLFVLGLAISLAPFERPGLGFFAKASGFLILGPTLFLVVSSFIEKISDEQKQRRNKGLFLIAVIVLGIAVLSANVFGLPSFRYLNAVNPFLTTLDPLTDSVAEHSTTTVFQSFLFNSVFMVFAGIGAWLVFKNLLNPTNQKRDLHIFALIFGLLGVYISSAFIRLELFSSLALVILGSIGLSLLTKEIFKPARQDTKKPIKPHPITIKISFLVVITIFLIIPMMVPVSANWINGAKAPPTILNGGSNYNIATNDWLDAMQWLKENTPKDAVIASWWDYGYWITTLGERKSLVDNATLDTEKIKKISTVLLSSPDESWMLLNDGSGVRGYSYVFDGIDDYVDFQETEFITESNSITMNVWIKTSNPYHQVIMSNTNNEQIFELGVSYSGNVGQPYLLIQDVSGDKKIQVVDTMVTDNEWHMITVVFDQNDDRLQIFVDGEDKNGYCLDCTFNKGINHNTQRWTLGKNFENKFWNGKIDDLSFWNRPLTNNEIKTLYNQNKGIDAREVGIDALLAFYDFDGQALNNQIHQNYDVRGYYNDIALGSSADGINHGVHVGNRSLDADYVLIYVAAQRVNNEDPALYFVQGGGDESKKQWFMRIGGFDTQRFLYDDGISATPEFWNETLLGRMIPFTIYGYVDVAGQKQSQSYVSGFTPVYIDDIKYPKDANAPLRLAYMSPGFTIKSSGAINGVLIYEVNKDYIPIQTSKTEQITPTETIPKQTVTISTNFGDIVIQLKPEVAPKTVENFVKLADSKFYDGTLFHRIISTFVIQGGDPNTKDQPPGTWGTGGPGYSIDAEISNLKHTKYIVSMARGTDINSAGSQFFIMTGDAPFLDGKYTIFGEVTEGKDVVDKIASLQTDLNDRPVDHEAARISSIRIS